MMNLLKSDSSLTVSIVITVINFHFNLAECVVFTDCGSKAANVISVHVQNCSVDDKSCQIETQYIDSVKFGIHFTTEIGIYDPVTSIGTARKWGMHAQIFSNLNICNNSLSCPLQPDNHFYKDDVLVPGWVPKGEASVQWKLSSGSVEILCVEVDVNVL
ncbi:uncharacterized protein LOC111054611 [Nilaparvata lugens]|uniref:uncharacterized protein LOC111054611 n=1 Tax=Nilaparvata lugens TaxID=108931 RepID=UPI000B99B389|nr:uncharacterized protein LOC111054611 [Nilaparvata lugens]